ncbi:MAG: acyl-ACP--UDP-N-acetylglucosamine O-acyltransferase [Ignavibacteriales bacterium]|nr:acyl-ACP--UDP-N-acetylglucosamine O-acyltransferase [Ignavibacteriales bacterium]
MSILIDSRAIVSSKAQIGENVKIGPFTIIEDDVVIGTGTQIGANAIIANGARIGKECKIHHGAVLGTLPQDIKFRDEATTLEIGDHNVIREYVTMNRGTQARMKTNVGNHCFIMAYVHVAHDCSVGNNVIIANATNMGGHCVIEDHAVLGGIVGIHQFSHIGCHSMIGACSRVTKDVPPYTLTGSEPLTFKGLNVIGLRRRGFKSEAIQAIDHAYHLIYNSQMNVSQALEKIRSEEIVFEEVKHIIEFIEKSKRGIIGRR